MVAKRRYPIGAEVDQRGVHFRVWAPDRHEVTVSTEGGVNWPLKSEGNGYFSGWATEIKAGADYFFELDQKEKAPDPASRFQPTGPHGPSRVIEPSRFAWTDQTWLGRPLMGTVIYEMHIGTFTKSGTWSAATVELEELASIGINCIEVMPIADFAGRFGWGYDGVNLFAPTRLYGTPDEFRHFVDTAHRLRMAVILDVVYNHLGPDGNYLGQFAKSYFTDRYQTDWGAAINFDGDGNAPVREYFLTNAAYWIDEFHLDGLRLDATQNIYDQAPPEQHILTEIGRSARNAAPNRTILITTENEPQDSDLCRTEAEGGYQLDAVWNDDFHHSAMVALTGHREAYYSDYHGSPQELISTAKYGYLYQGQWYSWQQKPRGKPGFGLPPAAYINYIQNHDQVANSARGRRAHQVALPGRYRATLAFTLLAPGTPLLFQGQEFAASTPFHYFADHKPELNQLIDAGRVEFLVQFPSLLDPAMREVFAPATDEATFQRCKLDLTERKKNAAAYQLTKDLLRLRRSDPAFQAQAIRGVDGAVLGPHCLVLRYFVDGLRDRLLIVNLGPDYHLSVVAEPLLAAPVGMKWANLFSTESPQYDGNGTYELDTYQDGWRIPGESAVVLQMVPRITQLHPHDFQRTQEE